jgi:hypothetical protein
MPSITQLPKKISPKEPPPMAALRHWKPALDWLAGLEAHE